MNIGTPTGTTDAHNDMSLDKWWASFEVHLLWRAVKARTHYLVLVERAEEVNEIVNNFMFFVTIDTKKNMKISPVPGERIPKYLSSLTKEIAHAIYTEHTK